MKRTMTLIVTVIFVLAGAGLVTAEMHQQGETKQMHEQGEMQQRHPSEQQMEWFCPWCGAQSGTEMGQGMMGARHDGRPADEAPGTWHASGLVQGAMPERKN